MYLVDYHTHSSYFSPDGRSTMEELCEAAIARGISELCVTEHCDVNGWDGKPCELDDDSYYDMLDRMRGIYGERLIILSGLELGQPTQNMDLARRYASNPRLDFIIGSLHNLEGFEDFYFLEYPDEESCRPLISRYFSEQYEMVEKADFDVLGHICISETDKTASILETRGLEAVFLCSNSRLYISINIMHIIGSIFSTST
jgi:histidinol-phosphatase (PHP family)